MCQTLAFGYITRGAEANSCQFRFESHKYHKASRYTAMAFLKTTLILGLVFFSIAHISKYKFTYKIKVNPTQVGDLLNHPVDVQRLDLIFVCDWVKLLPAIA